MILKILSFLLNITEVCNIIVLQVNVAYSCYFSFLLLFWTVFKYVLRCVCGLKPYFKID